MLCSSSLTIREMIAVAGILVRQVGQVRGRDIEALRQQPGDQ